MIPYNPCGKAVDIGRRSYKTTWRPFSDSETTAEILWYPALPVAGTLPYPSGINSLDWHAEPWVQQGHGEVYGAERTWVRSETIEAAVGLHICGEPEWHADGSPFDPDVRVDYRPDKLPVCCFPDERWQTGGLVIDGTAEVAWDGTEEQTGGLVIDGTAEVAWDGTEEQTGGLVIDGTAEVAFSGTEEQTGGLVIDGTAEISYSGSFRQVSGLVIDGTAEVEFIPGTPVGVIRYNWTNYIHGGALERSGPSSWYGSGYGGQYLDYLGDGEWVLTVPSLGYLYRVSDWDGFVGATFEQDGQPPAIVNPD